MQTANGEVGPIIPVADVARARAFYEDQLGLAGSETPGGYQFEAGGATRLYLLEVPDDAGSGTWPLASFRVPDVDAAVAELGDRGVEPLEMSDSALFRS